jgi:hypothetical protein
MAVYFVHMPRLAEIATRLILKHVSTSNHPRPAGV